MKKIVMGAALAAAMLCGLPAAAAVTGGDFRTEADLPTLGSSSGPLVYERTGATLGAGYELDGGDFVSNPSGWRGGQVFVDWNAATNVLTLDSQDEWDFGFFSLSISNILFNSAQTITGITLLTNNLVDNGLVPITGFTGNSVTVTYDNAGCCFNFTGGSATFQVTLSDGAPAVPEPATWAMMIVGFGLTGALLRRKTLAAGRA